MTRKIKLTYVLLSLSLGIACLFSLSTGAISMRFSQIFELIMNAFGLSDTSSLTEVQMHVFWSLRLPRLGFALLVGLGLAVSGAALQGIFRNPLVDSGIVGIASGSALFATTFIVLNSFIPLFFLGNVQLTMAFIAFVGALLTAFLVFRISLFQGKSNTVLLILAGVALNALAGSLTGLLTYFADDKQLRDITFWSLGSLSGASSNALFILFPFTCIPFVVLMRFRSALNAFSLGESAAYFMGVNTQRVKLIVLVCATAMVGASVSFVGSVGFVGLVVPHILRLIVGPNHIHLLPMSALSGAILLVFADLLSRVLLPPTEIPIGIITAIIGTPVLIGIIVKQKKFIFA